MGSVSCFAVVLLWPLLPTAMRPSGGQGCLQLVLSYLGQMTNAGIRPAFNSLSVEDWAPSCIQDIFDRQLLGSGAG